jgi:hypothetical protein
MTAGLTQSERFVAWLCERAFLKLWTHPNPFGKKGKELCDCLVVCCDHVIIFSVKEIKYKETGDATTGWERWTSNAVDKSVQQIWGAERWLRSVDSIVRSDGREITLPPHEQRRYHRVSVSLGSRGQVPLRWGDFGSGFVHVLDEQSLTATFGELDTITDFVDYLSAVEAIAKHGVRLIFDGGGPEDILGLYVRNGPSLGMLESDGAIPDAAIITGDIWKGLVISPEYAARKADLKSSYAWDNLIEHYAGDLLTDGMFDMHSKKVTKNELALVAMARQPRGHRANLADSLLDFLGPEGAKLASRAVVAAASTAFVFLGGDSSERDRRARELALRCVVVRGRCKEVTTVVGIATDRPIQGKSGHSTDIAYLHMPELSVQDAALIDGIQRDLGYFSSTKWPG